jgi:hypothetical protein
MSYGTNYLDEFRQVGIYTGKILKGAKPAASSDRQPSSPEQ